MRTDGQDAYRRATTPAPEIQADLAATHRWLARYNAALDMAPCKRRKLLVGSPARRIAAQYACANGGA